VRSDGSPATGKTSKVIERLTAENERLRRELNAERAAREEALRGEKALRTRVEELIEKNNSLTGAFDLHDAALARKERRIDDLKSSLDHEVERRKRAEDREAEMSRELGEVKSVSAGEVARAKNIAAVKENEYEVLSRSYLGLQAQIDKFRQIQETRLDEIAREAREKHDAITRYEILYDSMRQKTEQLEENFARSSAILAEYRAINEGQKAEYDRNLAALAKETQELRTCLDEPFAALQAEHHRRWAQMDEQRDMMEQTLGEMRWVIGVEKSRRPDPDDTDKGNAR